MRYRDEANIEDPRAEGDFALFIEGVLEGHFKNRVEVSVYPVML